MKKTEPCALVLLLNVLLYISMVDLISIIEPPEMVAWLWLKLLLRTIIAEDNDINEPPISLLLMFSKLLFIEYKLTFCI